MDWYKTAVRPVLFRMKPERAEAISKFALRRGRIFSLGEEARSVHDDALKTRVAGIPIENPVGLGPGFDKNAQMVRSLSRLGFGYVVVGSVVSVPHEDNPHPIHVRYPETESLANCTGIPSRGVDYVVSNLRAFTDRRVPVIANMNDFSFEGYTKSYDALQPVVDGIEMALFCPNEKYSGFCAIESSTFDRLLTALAPRKTKPFLVKIRNYHDEKEREQRLGIVRLCVKHGVDGLTMSGTQTIVEPRLSIGKGNLTGRKIFPITLRNIHDIVQETHGKISVKASGGIFTGEDAFECIKAGATTVELVSGMVYEGLSIAKKINLRLLGLLKEKGFASIDELRGYAETPSPRVA